MLCMYQYRKLPSWHGTWCFFCLLLVVLVSARFYYKTNTKHKQQTANQQTRVVCHHRGHAHAPDKNSPSCNTHTHEERALWCLHCRCIVLGRLRKGILIHNPENIQTGRSKVSWLMAAARCESYGPTAKLTFQLCACEWAFRPHRMKQKLRCYLDVSPSCYYAKILMVQCPLIGERVRSDRLETWPRPPHGQYQKMLACPFQLASCPYRGHKHTILLFTFNIIPET